MTCILIPIAAKIAEYPVHPILRQFGYLFRFSRNVSNLSEQAERLKTLQLHVNQQVQRAISRGDLIEPQVHRWLSSVGQIVKQVEKIEEQSKTSRSCFGGFCPNCVTRYCISRKSTKKMKSIAEFQEQAGNFDRISRPAPLPGIEYSSSRNFIAFDSRIEATDQVLKALEEDECNAVVLHGNRGIGKTELAKEVGRRAKEMNLFDEVVMAVVDPKPGSTRDVRDIQNQIADMLGLKIREESDSGRARRLCLRLKNEKKTLIIFDDVRERLDLEAIGIPSGCKIMIATEKENVWRAMEDEGAKKVEIKALSEEESWSLFRRVTGEIVDNDPTFKVVAEDIVGKCRGLPLMIVSVGKRVKHRKIEGWKDASRIIGRLETKTGNLDELLNTYI
ncbi:probable disease resistance protein At1g61190 [Neltuma alba]|uniref:probable disease resistance protein At1g61190 n=1 Tax=Neltuma alba TaxID=207710 RepID=UPI0010A35707|nr:probable disease resistance protein At1g61190 [Prosopis alba]XP_028803964.1 probable disease resistance protein At1g61190 [Prosopis alba]